MPNTKPKPTGPEQVAAFFDKLDHPSKPAFELIRETILSVDKEITEHIKWNAPSFCHGGDDRITFNLNRSGDILLIFHRGAKPKPEKCPGRLIEDRSGLLEWPANDRAVLRFTGLDDVQNNKEQLRSLVLEWLKATED